MIKKLPANKINQGNSLRIPAKFVLPEEEKKQPEEDQVEFRGNLEENKTIKPQLQQAKPEKSNKSIKKALLCACAVIASFSAFTGCTKVSQPIPQTQQVQEVMVNVTKETSQLPPNQIWDEGKTPLERLTVLRQMTDQLEKDVFTAMHQENITPQETTKTMQSIVDFKALIEATKPEFPESKLPSNIEVRESRGMDTRLSVDITFKEASTIRHSHKNAVNNLDSLTERVQKTLQTQGSSLKETEGLIKKDPVDKLVKKDFNELKTAIDELTGKAKEINKNGNKILIDVSSRSTA